MADNRPDPLESATAIQSAQPQTRGSFDQGVIEFNRRLEEDLDADSRQELDSIFQCLSETTPMRDRIIEGTSTPSRVPATTTLNTVSTTTSSNKRPRIESGGLQPMGATSFTQLYTSTVGHGPGRSDQHRSAPQIPVTATTQSNARNHDDPPDLGPQQSGPGAFYNLQTNTDDRCGVDFGRTNPI
jgi:hypothetical protein